MNQRLSWGKIIHFPLGKVLTGGLIIQIMNLFFFIKSMVWTIEKESVHILAMSSHLQFYVNESTLLAIF